MQFNHRFQEIVAKVQAAEAVVQAIEARRAETLEAHISRTRKAIRVHNISISYNFSRSTTFVKEYRPFERSTDRSNSFDRSNGLQTPFERLASERRQSLLFAFETNTESNFTI